MRLLLLVVWFLFMASTSFWMPPYKGDLGGDQTFVAILSALVAGVAAIGVRGRAQSAREALLSALPTIGILVAATVAGPLMNAANAEYGGEPLYLYFGVALWGSWAVLVLSTALVSRTKWNGAIGIAVGCLVAVIGLFFFVGRID